MITPIYHEVSERLEQYIRENQLSGRLPGQGPLSRLLGVNPKTIGKALHILEEKRLVTIHGTQGVFVNEKLRERPSYKVIGLIGVTWQDERDVFMEQLGPYVQRFGYQLLGITGTRELFAQKPELLSSFPVDGLVFCYSSLTSACADYLRHEQIPMVTCNYRHDISWLNTVDFDHEANMRKTFGYLREAGHRRVGLISPPFYAEDRCYWEQWMRALFLGCMGEGATPDLYYSFASHDQYDFPLDRLIQSQEVMQALLHFLTMPDPPTALIVPSPLSGVVKSQLESLGIRVSADLSLVAWGTGVCTDFCQVELDCSTVIRQAIQRLLYLLSHQLESPCEHLVKMVWHPGKTLGPVRAPGPLFPLARLPAVVGT